MVAIRVFNSVAPSCLQIKLRDGIKLAMTVSAEANKFITETEPFKVVKTDPEHAATLVAACK